MKKNCYQILLYGIFIASLLFADKGFGQGYIAASRYIGENTAMFDSKMIVQNGETYILGSMYSSSSLDSYPITLGSNFSGNHDMIVTKLDSNGVIIWSRFLGGNQNDNIVGLKFYNGLLCVIGVTTSTNYPVTNGSSITGTNYNYVFTKINPSNGIINFSTYLPLFIGSYLYISYNPNHYSNIEIENNFLYLKSSLGDFSITNPNSEGTSLLKFNLVTNAVVNTFTLPGLYFADFRINAGFIYLTGFTSRNDFPVTNGSTFNGQSKMLYVKLNTTNFTIAFATYFGGTGGRSEGQILKLYNGNVYISGSSDEANLPVTDGMPLNNTVNNGFFEPNSSAFITCFNSNSNALVFCKALECENTSAIEIKNDILYVASSTNRHGTGLYEMMISKLNIQNGATIARNYLTSENLLEDVFAQDLIVDNGNVYLLGHTVQYHPRMSGGKYGTPSFNKKNIVKKFDNRDSLTNRGSSPTDAYLLAKINSANKICYSNVVDKVPGSTIPTTLQIESDNAYVLGCTAHSSYPVTTGPYIAGNNLSVLYWTKYNLNPTMPQIHDSIYPSSQTTCRNGFASQITGTGLIFPNSLMPVTFPDPQMDFPLKFQWQRANTINGPWSDINTATGVNYTPQVGLITQYYRRIGFASICGGTPLSISSVAAVMVNGNTAPQINLGNIKNTCVGNVVQLGGSPTATGVAGANITNYLWSAPSTVFIPNNLVSNPTITALSSKIYTVEVTDNNGCKQIGQQLVNAYKANAGADVSSCAGNIVRIGTAPIQGLAGVTYNWTSLPNDATMSCINCAQPDVHPVVPTTYVLTLTIPTSNNTSCSSIDTVLVTPISAPSLSNFAGIDRTICAGATTNLGTQPMTGFTYSWTPYVFLNNYQNAQTACTPNGSGSGNPIVYCLTATNAGCLFKDTVKVYIVGSIANAGADGCGPRILGVPTVTPNINETYQWTVISGTGHIIGANNTAQITVGASVGAPVIYRLTVTLNGQSCSDDVTVPVCPCDPPRIVINGGLGCPRFNINDSVRLIVSSTLLSPTFQWTPAAGLSSTTGSSVYLIDNIPRTYTVTATSTIDTSVHCNSSISVNDTTANIPIFSAQHVFTCPGISVPVGQPNVTGYTFSWQGSGLSSYTISNPIANVNSSSSFPVLVTDNLTHCTLKDTATVTVIGFPQNIAGEDVLLCNGGGIVQLGLAPLPNTTYTWSPIGVYLPSSNVANPTVNVTSSTNFTVTATNLSTGCSVTGNVDVIVSPSIPLFSFSDTIFNPCVNGAISLPAGPAGMDSYSWSPSNLVLNSNDNGPIASTLPIRPTTPTQFTLTVTNAAGCNVSASTLFTPSVVNVSPPIAGNDRNLCKNTITNLGGATLSGTYTWYQSPAVGGTLNSTNISNPTFTPSLPGIYSFQVDRDTAGCVTSANVQVTVLDNNELPPMLSPIICQNSCTQIGISSNSQTDQYSWNPTNGLSNPSISNPIACIDTNSVVYTLTVIDNNGCSSEKSLFVGVNPSPSHTVTVAPITACAGATGLSLSPIVSPAGSYNYLWSSNNGLSNIYAQNPTVSLTTVGTKNYEVVVTNNSTGCATTASTTVTANACTLPIKLESFTAAPQDKTVLLSWVVSEEINVLKYEIEFSTDGRNFWPIGNRAATNSTNYNLVHNSPVFGINYYRLKTIDKDGKISYGEIRTVNFKLAGSLTIYPNPANNLLYITFAANSINKTATVSVLAMDGKIMYQKNISKLSQTETLDVSKLANGCYIVRILTNKEVINKSVVVFR